MRTSLEHNYVRLFGKVDSQQVNRARTVYGPAAYLVDLLQLIDDHLDDWHDLKDRRPKIFSDLLLDEENSFTPVPYLDIVNDVLAAQVESANGGADPFKVLREESYPFELPFDLAQRRMDEYLGHLDMSAERLHKAFAESLDDETLARASLGIGSTVNVGHYTDELSGGTLIAAFGGRIREIGSTDVLDVTEFMDATGLSFDQIEALVEGPTGDLDTRSERAGDFFTNAGSSSYVAFSYDRKERAQNLINHSGGAIPATWFDRVARLIRLARVSGVEPSDLDLIVRTCSGNRLDDAALCHIAVARHLRDATGLRMEQVCILVGTSDVLKAWGVELLFDRARGRANTGSQGQPDVSGDLLGLHNTAARVRAARAVGMSDADVRKIVEHVRVRPDFESFARLGLDAFYVFLCRFGLLRSVVDLSASDLITLLDVIDNDATIAEIADRSVLIDFPIKDPEPWKILIEGSTEALMWVAQKVISLIGWMSEYSLNVPLIARVTAGRNATLPKDAQRQQVDVLNAAARDVRPHLLGSRSFIGEYIDARLSRLIHDEVSASELVAPTDSRLVSHSNNEVIDRLVERAISRTTHVEHHDFLGSGAVPKVARKIYENLLLLGHLEPSGVAAEDPPATTTIATDFSAQRQELFDIIRDLYEADDETSVHLSDLNQLGLSPQAQRELYSNLIFNRFLSDDGRLVETATFARPEFVEHFEINAQLGDRSSDALAVIERRSRHAATVAVPIAPSLFSELSYDEHDVDDLLRNLRFNDYLNDDNTLRADAGIATLTADTLLVESRFYPQRSEILSALQSASAEAHEAAGRLTADDFISVADDLIADWAYSTLESSHLVVGQRITDTGREFLDNDANADRIDAGWAFEPLHSKAIFTTLQTIMHSGDRFRLAPDALQGQSFTPDEWQGLVALLERQGDLDAAQVVPEDRLEQFLDRDYALSFSIDGFNDYRGEVFALLAGLSREQAQVRDSVRATVAQLAAEQRKALYEALAGGIGLTAKSIEHLSEELFGSDTHAHAGWLLPILQAVGPAGEISAAPVDGQLRTAYRRLWQFGVLVQQLKLTATEVGVAFDDQNLIEKYPSTLRLPKLPMTSSGQQMSLDDIDALVEARDGAVYIFKNEPGGTRYWKYSPGTSTVSVLAGEPVATLLGASAPINQVDAAYVDRHGNNVIVADGRHYVHGTTIDGDDLWQVQDRTSQIGNTAPDIEGQVDAAFCDAQGRTHLLSRGQVVRYSGDLDRADDGYPLSLAQAAQHGGIQIPTPLGTQINAAFVGTDGKTYFFRGDHFSDSSQPHTVQSTSDRWGQVHNAILESGTVDAFYVDAELLYALSGDQVSAYRDAIENEGVTVIDGFPKSLAEHFGTALPGIFHGGVDGACRGSDGRVHLFKGRQGAVIETVGSQTAPPAQPVNAGDHYGSVANNLATDGKVDAALVGLDGRLYVFSGNQYYRYSGANFAVVDPGFPRNVSDGWGGLDAIDAAFILDGKTYLFGTHAGTAKYVAYSTNDYTTADPDFPKEQHETDEYWLNLPEEIRHQSGNISDIVDAAFDLPDEKLYLFFDSKFVYFDRLRSWWSEPKSIRSKWKDYTKNSVDAAFHGKDGHTYFFHGDKHFRFSGPTHDEMDGGYPRPTRDHWGKVRNNIHERGTIDAALVLQTTDDPAPHTYLFSGDQFFRCSGAPDGPVDSGYPRLLADLPQEPGFAYLDPGLVSAGVDAAFADHRQVFLRSGDTLHVIATEPSQIYDASAYPNLAAVTAAVLDEGAVYVVRNGDWQHLSSVERNVPVVVAETPPLLDGLAAAQRSNVDAVLTAPDGNTYVFQGDRYHDLILGADYDNDSRWGLIPNAIRDQAKIDAVFVGIDGKTHVFCDNQYVSYRGDRYIGQPVEQADGGATIAANWGGLTSVRAAYVTGSDTYLIGPADASGRFPYVRYDSADYLRPPVEGPTFTDAATLWGMPPEQLVDGWDAFDAIVVLNERLLVFLKDDEYIRLDLRTRSWTVPSQISDIWPVAATAQALLADLEAAFVAADGTVYFFGDGDYASHNLRGQSTSGAIGDDWGRTSSRFGTTIDAAVVIDTHTYLFSGDHYVRYSDPACRSVDSDYPRLISASLRSEPGFEHLPAGFEASNPVVKGVIANSHNVYVFANDSCYAVSRSFSRTLDQRTLGRKPNPLAETGRVDAAIVKDAKTYLFSGDRYVRYSTSHYDTVDTGYPKRIATGLAADLGIDASGATFAAGGLDAAVLDNSHNNEVVYLFKGKQYWNSATNTVQTIAGNWGRSLNNFVALNRAGTAAGSGGGAGIGTARPHPTIDGAFVDHKGRLHVFKDGQHGIYPDTDQATMEPGCPRSIASAFKLPPSFNGQVDGAFTFQGGTYLTKGNEYVCYRGGRFDQLESQFPALFNDLSTDANDYRLSDIRLIGRFKQLNDAHPGDPGLAELLDPARNLYGDPYDSLSKLFGWDEAQLKWLKRRHAFSPQLDELERSLNLEIIDRLHEIFDVADALASDPRTVREQLWEPLYDASITPSVDAIADQFESCLQAKYGNTADWPTLQAQIHDALNVAKRDALIAYLVFKDDEVDDIDDLFGKLLIDVAMGEEAKTSRVKEAISAVQLYLHRYFLDLEVPGNSAPADTARALLRSRWHWMRNYRVWEANRKVFLYPENVIRPELRDTKTPEFVKLEESLMQGELNDETISRALNEYVDQFAEISRLTIAGGYVYGAPPGTDATPNNPDKKMVLFGRTKSEPNLYYYRTATFVDGLTSAVEWDPWKPVGIQIDASRVYPMYAMNRIFVFWAKIEVRSEVRTETGKAVFKTTEEGIEAPASMEVESVLQIYYSYLNLNGQWAQPQRVPHDISANSTIVDHHLYFLGEGQARDQLDRLRVHCTYTTERLIRPGLDKEGWVEDLKELGTSFFYIKAATRDRTYLIDYPGSYKPLEAVHLLPHEGASVDRFKAEKNGDGIAFRRENSDEYLLQSGSDQLDLSSTDQSRFKLARGSVGEGYTLHPAKDTDKIARFKELRDRRNHTLELINKNLITTSLDKRHASFQFAARDIQGATFDFNPEVNRVDKRDQDHDLMPSSGYKAFQDLFPGEDWRQIPRPVKLSFERDEKAMPWYCFDYKGGSFLCKPAGGGSATAEVGIVIPADLAPVAAAFHANNKTHLFFNNDNDGGRTFVCDEPVSAKQLLGDGTKITDNWGIVPPTRITIDNQVDAALERTVGGTTEYFLFRGNEYVRYSNLLQEYVDLGYPRKLASNPDNLPTALTSVDAAIQLENIVLFFEGDEFVTSQDDFLTRHKVLGDFLPGLSAGSNYPSVHEGRVVYHDVQWFSQAVSAAELNLRYSKIESQYPELSTDADRRAAVLAEGLDYAFVVDKTIYMRTAIAKKRAGPRSSEEKLLVRFDGEAREADLFSRLNKDDEVRAVTMIGQFLFALCGGISKEPDLSVWDVRSVDMVAVVELSGVPDPSSLGMMPSGANGLLVTSADECMAIVLNGIVDDGFPSSPVNVPAGSKMLDLAARPSSMQWEAHGAFSGLLKSTVLRGNITAARPCTSDLGNDFHVVMDGNWGWIDYPKGEANQRMANFKPGRVGHECLTLSANGFTPTDTSAALGREWVFSKNGTYHKVPDGKAPPDAKTIRSRWGKVSTHLQRTGRVDAAFTRQGKVFLISGNELYRYSEDKLDPAEMDPGYPVRLQANSDGLPYPKVDAVSDYLGNVPPIVRAVFVVGDRCYMFYEDLSNPAQGAKYSMFDDRGTDRRLRSVDTDFQWAPAEAAFDAAYGHDGDMHLFKGSAMYTYKDAKSTLPHVDNAMYDIVRLSSIMGSRFSQALFAGGIDKFLSVPTQELDELPSFQFTDTPTAIDPDTVIRVNPDRVGHEHFPVDTHLDFDGANGQYYWELFFHVPALIAKLLNDAQKFEEAKRWYEYVFDPTSATAYWQFLPFLASDIDSLRHALADSARAFPPTHQQHFSDVSDELKAYTEAFQGLAHLDDLSTKKLHDIRRWDGRAYTTTASISVLDNYLGTQNSDEARSARELVALIKRLPVRFDIMSGSRERQLRAYLDDPFDPHAIAALRRVAYRRSTVMGYIDNLLDWADSLFRQYTAESINEARILYVLGRELLGKRPVELGDRDLTDTATYDDIKAFGADRGLAVGRDPYDFLFDDVDKDALIRSSFSHAGVVHQSVSNPYFDIPENDQILAYWDRVADRLDKIHRGLNILGVKQPVPLFQPPIDPMALVNAAAGGVSIAAASASQAQVPHYRFSFMLDEARGLVQSLKEFGNDLLAALEKQDVEALSLLQTSQEEVVLELTQKVKLAQLREAELTKKNLDTNKSGVNKQLEHYKGLLENGLLGPESTQIGLMILSAIMSTAATITHTAAAIVKPIPNIKVGSPTTMGAETGGKDYGGTLDSVASALESAGGASSTAAEVIGLYAQHERSKEEWGLQQKIAESEIKQIELQIEGAECQIEAARNELATGEKQIEHVRAVKTFMRDKYSNAQLYSWMAGRLSAVYFQTYKMAHDLAKAAEMAYCFERALPASSVQFIGGSYFDSQRKGLLAGPQLGLDLDRMEQAYRSTNHRLFEITKSVSLVDHDPAAFFSLKSTGKCTFRLSEELFDYDFPGHYRRQVKTVAIALAAGTGKTVNATLTQLSNRIVMEPDPKAVSYLLAPEGEQPLSIRSDWRSQQQVAVSQVDGSGSSSGLFSLSFADERYLPFEGTGAVSSWRLELSGTADLLALTDAQIEIKYTAEQGGEAFGDAVKGMLKPYPAAFVVDIAERYRDELIELVKGTASTLDIDVTRTMFPKMDGGRITGIYGWFDGKDAEKLQFVLNGDDALTVRHNTMALSETLRIRANGDRWTLTPNGDVSKLRNIRLVVGYMARV